MTHRFSPSHQLILSAYSLTWSLTLPLLSRLPKTTAGLKKRKSQSLQAKPLDIWIQSASTGEAALTAQIVAQWPQDVPMKILATTNTPQGMDILKQINPLGTTRVFPAYCPLDRPAWVETFLQACRPKLVVLLETELWPGLLAACKREKVPVLLLNGRMTAKNLGRYLALASFWRALAPDRIVALDEHEAMRFQILFAHPQPKIQPNIKFDRCTPDQFINYTDNPLASIVKPQNKLIVLGSIRKQEETSILTLLQTLMLRRPHSIIALFPRHIDRIKAWQERLRQKDLKWTLRSTLNAPVKQGTIILWDTFGELLSAYALAGSAFVGGSLAPLGGQNFLEPLSQGIIPCIGPSWSNFYWVGLDIFSLGLVRQVRKAEEIPELLLEIQKSAPSREDVRTAFADYIQDHQGGTTAAIKAMLSYFPGAQDQSGR